MLADEAAVAEEADDDVEDVESPFAVAAGAINPDREFDTAGIGTPPDNTAEIPASGCG